MQVIRRVTDEIERILQVLEAANIDISVGRSAARVGDIESLPLEAIRLADPRTTTSSTSSITLVPDFRPA